LNYTEMMFDAATKDIPDHLKEDMFQFLEQLGTSSANRTKNRKRNRRERERKKERERKREKEREERERKRKKLKFQKTTNIGVSKLKHVSARESILGKLRAATTSKNKQTKINIKNANI